MTGSILQLIANNNINTIYLNGSPQITPFKCVYRRHTNFSIYEHIKYYPSSFTMGSKIIFDIEYNADLLSSTVLQIDLPTKLNFINNSIDNNIVEQTMKKYNININNLINNNKKIINTINIPKELLKNIKNTISFDSVLTYINDKIDILTEELNFNKMILLKKKNIDRKNLYNYLTKLWSQFIEEYIDTIVYGFFTDSSKKYLEDTSVDMYEFITENITTDKFVVTLLTTYIDYEIKNQVKEELDKSILQNVLQKINISKKNMTKLLLTLVELNKNLINMFIDKLNIKQDTYNFLLDLTKDFILMNGEYYINNYKLDKYFIISKYLGSEDKLVQYIEQNNRDFINNIIYENEIFFLDNSSLLNNVFNKYRIFLFDNLIKFIDIYIIDNFSATDYTKYIGTTNFSDNIDKILHIFFNNPDAKLSDLDNYSKIKIAYFMDIILFKNNACHIIDIFFKKYSIKNILKIIELIYHYPYIEKIIYEIKTTKTNFSVDNIVTINNIIPQIVYFHSKIKFLSKNIEIDLLCDKNIYFSEYINNYFEYDIFLQENFSELEFIEDNVYDLKLFPINDKIIFDGVNSYSKDFNNINDVIKFFNLFTEDYEIENFYKLIDINNLLEYYNIINWINTYNSKTVNLNVTQNDIADIMSLKKYPKLFKILTFNNIEKYLADNILSLTAKLSAISNHDYGNNYFVKKVNKYTENIKILNSELEQNILSHMPINLVNFAWTKELGHAIIEEIKLTIGGFDYEIHTGELLSFLHHQQDSIEKKKGYDNMIGNIESMYALNTLDKPVDKLFIPLRFFFCKQPSMTLPLIQLTNTNINITIKFAELSKVLFIESGYILSRPLYFKCSLIQKLIYLDDDERYKLSISKSEYLIERFKLVNTYYINKNSMDNKNSIKVKMNSLNELTKYIFWNVNFTNIALDNIFDDFLNWNRSGFNVRNTNNVTITNKNEFNIKYFSSLTSTYGIVLSDDIYNSIVSEKIYSYDYIKIKKIFSGIKLFIFGVERESIKNEEFYNYVTTYNTFFNTIPYGYYMYSYSLLPSFAQPSGHCNFIAVSDAYIEMTISDDIILVYNSSNVKIRGEIKLWACTENVLRVMSGMCGLVWIDI